MSKLQLFPISSFSVWIIERGRTAHLATERMPFRTVLI